VTTAALRRYGPELLGFLVSMHGDYDAASEAFSVFSERLWQSMRRFEWGCSLRAWCYLLARNAAIDVMREGRRGRRVGLSSPEVSRLAAEVRTTTMSALRSEKRSALERLRDGLSEEDRSLLVLRVDRGLAWREVALVLSERSADGIPLHEGEALKRESARLRKRFQVMVERLRAAAREQKLL
jgi:RNA polymerase sigma-70 factor (ECF subfamily)